MKKKPSTGLSEKINPKGRVFMQIWNAAGDLLETHEFDNLIVNSGKQALARLLGSGNSDYRVSQVGFGTNGTPPNSNNGGLLGGVLIKLLNTTSYAGNSVIYEYELLTSEGNGNSLQEFALITHNNELFSRVTRSPIAKTADIRITGTWTITF